MRTAHAEWPSANAREEQVVELPLVLSRQQFDALKQRAHVEGVSVGQLLRRLVHESVSGNLSA